MTSGTSSSEGSDSSESSRASGSGKAGKKADGVNDNDIVDSSGKSSSSSSSSDEVSVPVTNVKNTPAVAMLVRSASSDDSSHSEGEQSGDEHLEDSGGRDILMSNGASVLIPSRPPPLTPSLRALVPKSSPPLTPSQRELGPSKADPLYRKKGHRQTPPSTLAHSEADLFVSSPSSHVSPRTARRNAAVESRQSAVTKARKIGSKTTEQQSPNNVDEETIDEEEIPDTKKRSDSTPSEPERQEPADRKRRKKKRKFADAPQLRKDNALLRYEVAMLRRLLQSLGGGPHRHLPSFPSALAFTNILMLIVIALVFSFTEDVSSEVSGFLIATLVGMALSGLVQGMAVLNSRKLQTMTAGQLTRSPKLFRFFIATRILVLMLTFLTSLAAIVSGSLLTTADSTLSAGVVLLAGVAEFAIVSILAYQNSRFFCGGSVDISFADIDMRKPPQWVLDAAYDGVRFDVEGERIVPDHWI